MNVLKIIKIKLNNTMKNKQFESMFSVRCAYSQFSGRMFLNFMIQVFKCIQSVKLKTYI